MSKPDTSSDVKLEQPENIPYILVTFVVTKPDTSKSVKLEQFWNIEYILVTSAVSKSDKSMLIKFLQYLNIFSQVLTTAFNIRTSNKLSVLLSLVSSPSTHTLPNLIKVGDNSLSIVLVVTAPLTSSV